MVGSQQTETVLIPSRLRGTRRHSTVALAALVLALMLAAMATAIALSQSQSRTQITSTFGLRGTSSATFISTFLSQQAARETQTASGALSGGKVSDARFRLVVGTFGSNAAVLLDSAGRLLAVVPSDPAVVGRPIAVRYAHLRAAERGRVAVSNVVPSATLAQPVAAVAVPFSTPYGRRVFSAAYPVAGSALGAFVDHTVPYRQHEVFLVDASGRLLTASPATAASTLGTADPALARAMSRNSRGSVPGTRVPTTFTTAPVEGTSWRLVIAVPDSRLYASIGGWAQRVPWIVFALVSVFGALLVALLARSLSDRARLAVLSEKLEKTAQTDPLTGLCNRRALTERLAHAATHARRREEPMSVLMIDLDRFKETNDRFGHDAGDQVLRAMAGCLNRVFRADDIYGRWGGDEFLVVLLATDEDGARIAAGRLCAAASSARLSGIGLDDGIPLSVGAASDIYTDPGELVQRADVALYESKARGRGQVTIAEPSPLAS